MNNWYCKSQKKHVWELKDAQEFLLEHASLIDEAGFTATIIGSVAEKGRSENDLDILLQPKDPTCDCANFELLDDFFGGWDTFVRINGKEYQLYNTVDQKGRVVDFFFEPLPKL